ncbi:hypothetical protein BV20DRAFT_984110 [Pilatotrama ljubarskyi]|nr:hypothetical protein BV20DRAFT_984110 [Pilatotrama ljubarskyi]
MNPAIILTPRDPPSPLRTRLPGEGDDGSVVVLEDDDDVLDFTTKYARGMGGPAFDVLHFATGKLAPRAARALESFLRGPALSLQFTDLIIEDAEDLLASRKGLASAFALLVNVTHLELIDAGKRACALLRASHAKLTSVNLAMIPFEDDLDDDEDEDPITLLSNFQETLEVVHGQDIETSCIEDLSVRYSQRYPKVKELVLQDADIPFTVQYVRAFPNVSALRLRTAPEFYARMVGQDPRGFWKCRKVNIAQQKELGCWPSLRYCDTTLGTLYVLGLQCPVHDVRILGDVMGDAHMLKSVLTDTHPTILTLHQFYLDMLGSEGFASVLRGPAVHQVRTLEITLVLDKNSGNDKDVEKSLNAMVDALRPLQIRAFGLTLACNFAGPSTQETGIPASRVSLTPAEVFLRDLNLDDLARRIRTAVSSLDDVAVSMVAHRTRGLASAVLGKEARMRSELKTYQVVSTLADFSSMRG